jgi:hypothetical protein
MAYSAEETNKEFAAENDFLISPSSLLLLLLLHGTHSM